MNNIKTLATRMVVLTALTLFVVVRALAQEAAPIASKLDEYLSAAAKKDFTGSALVSRDGKVILSKGYGMANAEWDVPNTPQTKFRLGSITRSPRTATSARDCSKRSVISQHRWSSRASFESVPLAALTRRGANQSSNPKREL